MIVGENGKGETMVGKDTVIMQHWDLCVCESVDGTLKVIIGCRQWVERVKCNMMIEDRYMMEMTGLVCLYVCSAGGNEKHISLWGQIGTVSIVVMGNDTVHDNLEWKS